PYTTLFRSAALLLSPLVRTGGGPLSGSPKSKCDFQRRGSSLSPGLFTVRQGRFGVRGACSRFWSGSLLPPHASQPPGERLPLVGETPGGQRWLAGGACCQVRARPPQPPAAGVA